MILRASTSAVAWEASGGESTEGGVSDCSVPAPIPQHQLAEVGGPTLMDALDSPIFRSVGPVFRIYSGRDTLLTLATFA